jgi:hypothetical protein
MAGRCGASGARYRKKGLWSWTERSMKVTARFVSTSVSYSSSRVPN